MKIKNIDVDIGDIIQIRIRNQKVYIGRVIEVGAESTQVPDSGSIITIRWKFGGFWNTIGCRTFFDYEIENIDIIKRFKELK